MDPVVALQRRLGASWWTALMQDLRGAVRRGRILRLGGGTYALPDAEPEVVTDEAVVHRVTLPGCLRGPGSVEARRRLGLADARSGSLLETVLRLALREAGLPVECQVLVAGVGRVDLVVGGWLVVEVDGFEFHADRDSYRTDRRRGNLLVAGGFRLLRFSYEDVVFRRSDVVAQIAAVYSAGR